jgi:hypothetical protein
LTDPRAFLERWSRLKHRAAAKAPAAAPPAPDGAPPPTDAAAEDVLKDLPPVESLGRDSDYRAFMRPGVPEALRNRALQKLWVSDPVYANLDGLVEYGEDFGEPFRAAGVVATLYRVLEGMPAPDPAETAPAEASVAAAPPAASASIVGPGQPSVIESPLASDGQEDQTSQSAGFERLGTGWETS